MKPKDGLLLVDSLNFCYRYRKRNSNYSADFITDIRAFAQSFLCKDVIILADRYGSRYRKAMYPEYKARRPKAKTEEEKQEVEEFMSEYNRTLEMCKDMFKVIVLEGVEADDTITYLTLEKALTYTHVMILSTDKDFNQLVTHNVSRFSYVTRKETNIYNFEEQNGCLPSEFVLMKCLVGETGESSDNIPGVEGIGKKRGATLAGEYCELELLRDALPIEGKQKFIKNLNASMELLERNDKLMNLSHYKDILTKEEINHIEEVFNA